MKKKLFTSEEIVVLKYFLSILFKNKIILISLIMFVSLSAILPSLILVSLGSSNITFFNQSLSILSIPSILSFIYIAISTILIFSKTKTNDIDLFMYIKPIKKNKIVLLKQMAIFLSSMMILIGTTASFIAISFQGINFMKSSLIFLITIFSVLINNVLFIILFSFIGIFLKFTLAITTIMLTTFSMVGFLVIPIIITNVSEAKSFNILENKNSIVKIYDIDNNGDQISKKYAIYENPLGSKTNEFNAKTSFTSYNPFNILFGYNPVLSSGLISRNVSKTELYMSNGQFSINQLSVLESPLKGVDGYTNVIIKSGGAQNIFDYTNKNDLFNAIETEIINTDIIKQHLSDDNYWNILKLELEKRLIWDASLLSSNQVEIIEKITGITVENSLLYDLFVNSELVKNKIIGFDKYIENKYGSVFSKFINFMLTSSIIKENIYSYDSLKLLNKINVIHPIIDAYDELKDANYWDIKYIKNKFFNTNLVNGSFILSALDKNSVYRQINNIKNIFGVDINSKTELENYIEKNKTINNLKDLLVKIDSEFQTKDVLFRNNISNSYLIEKEASIETKPKYIWNAIFVTSFAIAMVYLGILINSKMKNGDLI